MTYNFPESGTRYIKAHSNPTLVARFHNSAHDGFRVEQCINARERRLLRFLVPVLKLEKVAFITNHLLMAIRTHTKAGG